MTQKSPQQFRRELQKFQRKVIAALTVQLSRIGRPVPMGEIPFIPFSDDVESYIENILLDPQGDILVLTSFNDTQEKYLTDFLSDGEISPEQLIALLEMLSFLPGENGPAPLKKLLPSTEKYISFVAGHPDHWICVCTNTADDDGFYPCNEYGALCEPCQDWDYLYRCDKCGRVIHDPDHRILGIYPFSKDRKEEGDE